MKLYIDSTNLNLPDYDISLENNRVTLSYYITDNKLFALVYPDYESVDAAGISHGDLDIIMEENRKQLNTQVGSYENIAKIVLYPTEFVKTPKRNIRRYLYTNLNINV